MAQVRTPLAERHDDELVALARGGDEQAFAELYQRYFRGLYDFSLRMVRDREAASDVVQSTFVKAWASLSGEKRVENVKAWLYAVARNLAIDELRRRQRVASPRSDDDEDPIYTLVDERRISDPSIAAHDDELVEMVWESASALSPQEYSLLDLHLRQGLDADELSETLGLAKGAVYTRLTRLRDSLDEAVTAAVLMRRGRRECEELDALLDRLGATKVTREVRRAVNEHVKDCDICSETKKLLITPAELFAGIAFVPVPPGLADEIWQQIATQLGFGGAGAAGVAHAGGGPGHGGHGVPRHGKSSVTKGKALTVLGTLGVIAIIGALLFPRGGVTDPKDVHSTTHQIAVPTVVPVVHVAWTQKKGADGYSVNWTHAPRSEPDAVTDLPGSATGATSPALGPGSWWFHLRTHDNGSWTHTVHLGPFIVIGSPLRTALIVPLRGHSTLIAARRRTPLVTQAALAVASTPLGGPTGLGGAAGSGATGAGGVSGASVALGAPGGGAGSGATAPGAPGTGSTPPTTTTTTTTPSTEPPAPPADGGATPPNTPATPPGGTTTTTTTTTTPSTPPDLPQTQPADKPPPDNTPTLPPDEIQLTTTTPQGAPG